MEFNETFSICQTFFLCIVNEPTTVNLLYKRISRLHKLFALFNRVQLFYLCIVISTFITH